MDALLYVTFAERIRKWITSVGWSHASYKTLSHSPVYGDRQSVSVSEDNTDWIFVRFTVLEDLKRKAV